MDFIIILRLGPEVIIFLVLTSMNISGLARRLYLLGKKLNNGGCYKFLLHQMIKSRSDGSTEWSTKHPNDLNLSNAHTAALIQSCAEQVSHRQRRGFPAVCSPPCWWGSVPGRAWCRRSGCKPPCCRPPCRTGRRPPCSLQSGRKRGRRHRHESSSSVIFMFQVFNSEFMVTKR